MSDEKINFTSYRYEILANDFFHKALAVFLVLIIIGLTITYNVTGNSAFVWYVPLLTVSLLGTIIRLDTMVHRMGWFLEKSGDPWERDRKKLLHDKEHLIIGDVFMLLPALVCLGQSYFSLQGTNANIAYSTVSGILIGVGIITWIRTPSRVRRSKV